MDPITQPHIHISSELRRQQIEGDLCVYEQLKEGWDGDHSFGPDPNSVILIREIVANLPFDMPVPVVGIGSMGDLMLYWDTATAYMELSHSKEGLVMYVRSKQANNDHMWEWIDPPQNLNELLINAVRDYFI